MNFDNAGGVREEWGVIGRTPDFDNTSLFSIILDDYRQLLRILIIRESSRGVMGIIGRLAFPKDMDSVR
jgi:hypothetical protein